MIPFYKMHGTGNDFILIDNTSEEVGSSSYTFFNRICQRHTGIGADGVMLLEKSEVADFRLQFYNADGFPAGMCGNGSRCAVWLAHQLKLAPQKCVFEIGQTLYQGEVLTGNLVQIRMKSPKIIRSQDKLKPLLTAPFLDGIWVEVGVPHLVLTGNFCMEDLDIEYWGRYFRYHPEFQPSGTNVIFIEPDKMGISLSARAYERGVEQETLGCGTGAIAAVFYLFNKNRQIESPVFVDYPGGLLSINFSPAFKRVFLIGQVVLVYTGQLNQGHFEEEVMNPDIP